MKLANIKYFCTQNSPGFSTSVFCSGCSRKCPGCFNKIAWDYNYGHELTEELIDKIISETEAEQIKSLCILGGEPLDPINSEGIKHIIERFREHFGTKKSIWIWTGYVVDDDYLVQYENIAEPQVVENYDEIIKDSGCKFENVPDNDNTRYILNNVDYIVDGPFVSGLHSFGIRHRGSTNQRILHKIDK